MRRFCGFLALTALLLLCGPPLLAAAGDSSVVVDTFMTKTAHYSVITVTSEMNGTTAVKTELDLPFPFQGGVVALICTGETNTAVITQVFWPSGLGFTEADSANEYCFNYGGVTVASTRGVDLRPMLFNQVTTQAHIHDMVWPPGTWTYKILSSNAASAGTCTTTITVRHF